LVYKANTNTKDALNKIKESISKKVKEIEKYFFQIGTELIIAQGFCQALKLPFRDWITENSELSKTMAYSLIKLVKMDKNISNKSYKNNKNKISLFKLIYLLKYSSEFLEQLDFKKDYELPGGHKASFAELPREYFTEVAEDEYKTFNTKQKGESKAPTLNQSIEKAVLEGANTKLDKMADQLENLSTILQEININPKSLKTITPFIEKLETQSKNINKVAHQLLTSLKNGKVKKESCITNHIIN